MFDLETAIADWKQSLANRESLSADNIAELETHLRDAISTLGAMSLNDEEAFLIARHRVGSSAAIGNEYAKENPSVVWIRRVKWMCLGALMLMVYRYLTSTIINTSIAYFTPMGSFQGSFGLVLYMTDALSFASILVLGLLVTIRYAPWLERVSIRFLQFPKSVVVGLFLALIALSRLIQFTWWLLFDFCGVSGYATNSLQILFLISTLISPVLLALAVYYLHRREQSSETA